MSTIIKATGEFSGGTPSIAISSGRGNTNRPEIHIAIRDDSDPESTRVAFAWFDRDEILAAIDAEDAKVRRAIEVGEPA